ncbi:MAG TPA: DNA repair protein RadC [Candidatus Aphodovivens excrementavium]|nr:DNA repair protein RadC [Candidatus Aphodovivens excrementavium]
MNDLMPREKLKRFGAARLTDLELLRILIGSGNQQASAEQIAKSLLKLLKEQGPETTYEDIAAISGMGPAKTCEIVALFELGRRYLVPAERPVIKSAQEAFEEFKYLKDKRQEHFAVLTLDGANRLIDNTVVFVGTLDQSIVHPREIFAKALEDRAAFIVLAHNHPSGSLDPSPEDEYITEKLKTAGDLMGIKVLDHLIVTKQGYRSIIG